MSKKQSTSNAMPAPATRFHLTYAVAFNVGMALFIAGAAWDLLHPSSSDALYWWKRALLLVGLAVAGLAWVAGSNLSGLVKSLLSAVIVGAILCGANASKVEYDVRSNLMQEWHVEADRIIHDGLGVSTAALPGWSYNFKPRRLRNHDTPAHPSSRLATGELAVFLEITHRPSESSNAESTIVLEGGPMSLDDKSFMQFAVLREEATAQRPNVTILQHLHEGQVDGVPAMIFAYEATDGRHWQETIFRSGPCLLTLFTSTASEDDLRQVNQFVQSLRFIAPG